jgi:hypothetical protein
MKHRNSHLLIGYWSRLRKGRSVPDQTAIDPRAIKRILSQVFILDAEDAIRPRYRLAGTSHCDRYGMELRGTNFGARWDILSRDSIAQLLRQSLATGQPICLSSLAESEGGIVEMETVLAPLCRKGTLALYRDLAVHRRFDSAIRQSNRLRAPGGFAIRAGE